MGTKGHTVATLGKQHGAKFTKRQLKVIDMIAAGHSIKAIMKETGVSQPTMYRWRKNPLFLEAVLEKARFQMREHIPVIYNTIVKQATAGDFDFIKLMLTHLEKLEDMKAKATQGTITFTWEAPSCQK